MNFEKMTLGIELGSTRIKGVLIDENHNVAASGSFNWENELVNGVWTYKLEDAVAGIRACYTDLRKDAEAKYGEPLRKVAAIGISGMMHGYLVLDKEDRQLAPFRTYRNNITAPAATELMELFKFNIPQRWSIAHLYQAILNGEEHVPAIDKLLTLSVYIHYLLTGEFCVGVGEASGMFPYDDEAGDFDAARVVQFDKLTDKYGFPWKLKDIMPKVLRAGEQAGSLSAVGAALLDESGNLQAGIPMCPPEGDAGTGMVATNAIEPRTGNVSVGTSAFSMQVLERPMRSYYPQIDVAATPAGKSVAMVHCCNGTPDIDAWVGLFADTVRVLGLEVSKNELYEKLFRAALEGDPDCGGIVSLNYLAGEHLTETEAGRPLIVRLPDSKMTAPNFMRAQLYAAIATLRLGMQLIQDNEQVETDRLLGHGGYFKTPGVGQQFLADALNVPVTTMETAGEGGPWGMALLAAYMMRKEAGESLEDYLNKKVFSTAKSSTLNPTVEGVAGFETYFRRHKACLRAEEAAADMV